MSQGAVGNREGSLRVAERPAASATDRLLDALRRVGPPLAGSVLPFALVLYLALRGGGYDVVVRDEVGLAAWWIVLLGAIVGALPLARLNRPAMAGLGLFGAFAAWTALSLLWTESTESSFEEVARVATYGAVFVLALALQGRDGLRRTVNAVGAAIAVVALLAVLSRLHPSWFPANELAQAATGQLSRLSYPLNYWNGVAAFVAIGIPLVLAIGVGSKRLVTQVLATAALPLMALAIFYTYSRTGAAVALIGVVAFLAVKPGRLAALPAIGLGTIGGTLLLAAASQREELRDGLLTETALQQGDEMIAVVIVTVAGVAFLRAAIGLAARYGIGPRPRLPSVPRPSRGQALAIGGAVVALAAGVAVASGLTSTVGDRWEEFKTSTGAGDSTERFAAASGNGRYQYWDAAIDAFRSEPVTGIGAGSYEYFWLREGSIPGNVRDAHSLYFETLGELGVVGLGLLLGLVGLVVVRGARATRRAGPGERDLLAGAFAAAVVFALAAGNDWMWELAVIPVAFLMLAAAILAWRREPEEPTVADPPMSGRARVIAVAVALPILAVIAISLLGARAIQDSDEAYAAGDFDRAVDRARAAQDFQPYAATPYFREAQALLEQGEDDAAIVPARESTEKEPTNWMTWYTVWEVEESRAEIASQVPAVYEAYRRAAALNPRDGRFASALPDSEAAP